MARMLNDVRIRSEDFGAYTIRLRMGNGTVTIEPLSAIEGKLLSAFRGSLVSDTKGNVIGVLRDVIVDLPRARLSDAILQRGLSLRSDSRFPK